MLSNEIIIMCQAVERELALANAERRARLDLQEEGWSLRRPFRSTTRFGAPAQATAGPLPALPLPAAALPEALQPADEWITSLGGDGQILLPRQVRQRLGLKTLDRLCVRIEQDRITISPA